MGLKPGADPLLPGNPQGQEHKAAAKGPQGQGQGMVGDQKALGIDAGGHQMPVGEGRRQTQNQGQGEDDFILQDFFHGYHTPLVMNA